MSTSLAQVLAFHPITDEWGGRRFNVEIPAGYEEVMGPSIPGAITFGFVGARREDNTRPMVQITLAHFPTLLHKEAATISLEEFGNKMIIGVERRKEEWKAQVTYDHLGHIRVKRYAWSGLDTRLSGGRLVRSRMLGVMYVGIDRDIGFSLHTQDLEQHSKETLSMGEHSIRTFRLSSPKPR